MHVSLPDLRYDVEAIVQEGSQIWATPDRNSFMLICSAVSSGSFKAYGSADYDPRNPSAATWVPVSTFTLAGVETAPDTAFTPVDERANVGSCVGFNHIRVVEQNAGTASLQCVASAFALDQLVGAIAVSVTADTELPAAAALADNTANPTVPAVGSFLMVFDGATWDRWTGAVTNAGTFAVQNNGHGKTKKTFSGTLTSDTDVVAAVTSKRIKVNALYLRVITNTEQILIAKSNGTGGTELWRAYLRGSAANVPDGNNLAVPCPDFLFGTVAGEKLTFDVSSGATVHYSGSYWDDDAT